MAGNSVTLVGNLTREPELRYTQGGQSKATLGLAVNRRWQDRNGEWQEDTSFFNVVVWGDMAEHAQSLPKGARVIVTGRLQQRSWETEQGDKRNVVEVVADEIGPSLRWATVEVHRTERRGPGEAGGRPAPVAAPAATAAPATAAAGAYDEFEEPF